MIKIDVGYGIQKIEKEHEVRDYILRIFKLDKPKTLNQLIYKTKKNILNKEYKREL